MKKLPPLLVAVLTLTLLGSDSPKDYDDRTQLAGIEGAWRRVEVKVNGQVQNDPGDPGLIFRGQKFEWTGGGGGPKGTYTFNTSHRPAHLDMKATDQPVNECIFQVDGEVLLLAFRRTGTGRPKNFEEQEVWVETFRRVRK
jgi:uncharacterized protein (TIGR03067 family)